MRRPLFVVLLGELRRWGLAPDEIDQLLPGRRPGPGVDRATTATATATVSSNTSGATERGLDQPGVEGLLGRHQLRRRVAGGAADRAVRGAGLRLRRLPGARARCQGPGDDDDADQWTARAADAQGAVQRAVLAARPGLLRDRARRRQAPVDALRIQHGPLPVERHRRRRQGSRRRRPPDVARDVQRLGVRTLAADMGAYNPVSYHNGSVWPHDNALIAAGLMRYGLDRAGQADRLGMLDAAASFGGRLPELFCGFDRSRYPDPVPYPTSCSPQAWASAAPVLIMRALARLDPCVPTGDLWIAPAFPEEFGPVSIENLPLAGTRVSIDYTANNVRVDGLPDGIILHSTPRPLGADLFESLQAQER